MKIGFNKKINVSYIKYIVTILCSILCSEVGLILIILSQIRIETAIAIAFAVFILQIIGGILIIRRIINSTKQSITAQEVSNLAHDLKSPLASVKGFVQAMKDGTISKEETEKYYDVIISQIDRVNGYINSVSEMTKLSSGVYIVNKSEFDVNKIIVQNLILLEKRIKEKNIDIKGIDNNENIVYADNNLMSRAIYNLIENAVKYVNNNGYIKFELINNKMNSIICIENSGIGMTKKECENVFNRFYRTDSAKSKDGLGLGLNITKQMVELCGGKISVNSIPDNYVRFVIELPKH